jgi:hypothetical protein
MRSASLLCSVALLLTPATDARGAGEDLAAPDAPPSTGRHCLGRARPAWLASAGLVGALNPRGLELQLEASRCQPLITAPGRLYDLTNLQAGLAGYLSPAYAMPGAFLSIRPLSVLELRAEGQLIQQWNNGLDGAGYFPLPGYHAPWSSRPAAGARSARGATASLTATLRGELQLAGPWSLVGGSSTSYQHWQLGDADYYYNVRLDLPLARRDRVVRNLAAVLVQRRLTDRAWLRAGVADDLLWVEGSGYHQNVLAALLTGGLAGWPGPGHETQAFLRVGGYTAHASQRGQAQLVAGVSTTFDLAPGPTR